MLTQQYFIGQLLWFRFFFILAEKNYWRTHAPFVFMYTFNSLNQLLFIRWNKERFSQVNHRFSNCYTHFTKWEFLNNTTIDLLHLNVKKYTSLSFFWLDSCVWCDSLNIIFMSLWIIMINQWTFTFERVFLTLFEMIWFQIFYGFNLFFRGMRQKSQDLFDWNLNKQCAIPSFVISSAIWRWCEGGLIW